MVKHKALRRRIVAILDLSDEPITAGSLVERLIDSGLSQRYIGNTGRVAQVLKSTKGVTFKTIKVKGNQGETHMLHGYVLESHDAFTDWVKNSW